MALSMNCHPARAPRLMSGLIAVAVAVLLGGCTSLAVMSHVPLSTMSRLSALKLADIAPEQLRVAAQLNDDLEPLPGGVKVRITVVGGKPEAELDLTLEPALETAERAPLAGVEKSGRRLWVYRLSAGDVERVRRLIAETERGRAVSIAAGVDACRRRPLGNGPLPTTTLLRVDRAGYFVLTGDLDLRKIVDERALATRVPPCP